MNWTATVYTSTDLEFPYVVQADTYAEAQDAARDRFDARNGTMHGDIDLIMVAPAD